MHDDEPAGAAPGPETLKRGIVGKTAAKLAQLGLEFAVPTNPKLEKRGLEAFARHERDNPTPAGDEIVHILDDGERARIRAFARRMILIAFGIGAASGLVSSIASFLLAVPEGTETTFWEDVSDFAIVNVVTIVATMIEVAWLYRFALQTVHRIAREAGIRLAPKADDPDLDERRAVALALARTALELPNPPKNAFGIDPYRGMSRLRLVVTVIFYKLKISLTNFVLRILIRRIGGRAIVKAYLTFTDVLVTGAWDAWVAWRMTRQARIRALGPSACESLIGEIVEQEGELRPQIYDAMMRAVAATIVRDHDVHPNLLALMRAIVRRSGVAQVPDLDAPDAFHAALERLDVRERLLVLEVLVLATFPDGDVSRAEAELLEVVLARAGRRLDRVRLMRVCKAFVRGDAIPRAALQAVFARPAPRALHDADRPGVG